MARRQSGPAMPADRRERSARSAGSAGPRRGRRSASISRWWRHVGASPAVIAAGKAGFEVWVSYAAGRGKPAKRGPSPIRHAQSPRGTRREHPPDGTRRDHPPGHAPGDACRAPSRGQHAPCDFPRATCAARHPPRRHPVGPKHHQIVILTPSSTTRSLGIRKNSVAGTAFRAMNRNSAWRHHDSFGAMPGTRTSRPRK